MINHHIKNMARHEFNAIHHSVGVLRSLVETVDFPAGHEDRAEKCIKDLETALLGPVARLRLLLGVEHEQK